MGDKDLQEVLQRSILSIIAVLVLNIIQNLTGLENSMAAQYTKGLIVGGILFGRN